MIWIRHRWALALTGTALALAVGTASASAAQLVPWGGGCMPTPPGSSRTSSNCGAELGGDRATAPAGAPAAVREVIEAANRIDNRPYVWGGGHLGWVAKGYDCSGAVGYALHGADLLDQTMVSGQLADWGEAGVGRWITIYANAEHVYMVVAGLRFDTRDDVPGISGPRWHQAQVEPRNFVARHPTGL